MSTQEDIKVACREYLKAKKFSNRDALALAEKLKIIMDADLAAFAEENGFDIWAAREWLRLTDSIPALRLRVDAGRKYLKENPTSEKARVLLHDLSLSLAIDENMWEHLQAKSAQHTEAF